MYGYVYKVTNNVNNKIYIGQHRSEYFDESYYGSGSYFLKALNKYGEENFTREIIEECDDYLSLNEREEYWIEYYHNLGYEFGITMYNIKKTSIGGDTYTYAPIEHQLLHSKRLSEARSGRKYSDETCLKISNALKGKSKSAEQIEKHKIALKKKHRHWYTNGQDNLLIPKGDEIPDGFYLGRTYSDELKAYIKEKTIEGNKKHNKVTWNKGLTKETDERVANYGKSLSKHYWEKHK